MSKKIVVVTALIGAYDSQLMEFEYDRDKYHFVCYTNLKRLKSNTWEIRYVDELAVPNDNAKSSYWYKWNPHKYLNKRLHDTMVWVDSSFNAINLNGLDNFIDTFNKLGVSLYIEKHPGRNTLRDELNANVNLNKDNIDAMKNQVARYFNEGYSDNDTVMVETGFSIRKFKDPNLIKFSEAIWNELAPEGNTKRDQLVYDYCMWKTSFTDYALFTFQEKSTVIRFQDHPNRSSHKDKVLLVGPWLGEDVYEHMWVDYVEDYVATHPVDKVIVGCRTGREYVYDKIQPDKFVITDNDGTKDGFMIDGNAPVFKIKNTSNVDTITLSPDAKWFNNGKLKKKSPSTVIKRKVNVYINYYVDKNIERNKELEYCLNRIINNENVDNIYLIIDRDLKPKFDKCENVYVERRPTYDDIFNIINRKTKDTDINIILNSDCFLDEEGISLVKENICPDEVWALNRKEIVDNTDKESIIWTIGVNEAGSQDCWINVGKYKDIPEADFTMGVMGCDNRIVYLLNDAGYVVLNPSKDVHVYHKHKTNIRNYNDSMIVKMPYLMVNSCFSTNKKYDVANLTYNNHLNPYFTHPIDEKFTICCVVTKRVLQEFLLFRYSVNQYHNKCTWLLSTDAEVAESLKKYQDIECRILVETEGSHRFNDVEQQKNFNNVIKTKLDIARISIEKYGYAFLMDTDMIMLSEFPAHMFNLLKNSSFDTIVSHHRLLDKQLENRVGKFNVGMVILRSEQLLNDWVKHFNTGQYFYEQKPYEVAIDNGGYIVGLLPDSYNVAYWRVDNDKSLRLELLNDKDICLNNMLIVNAHVHMIPDDTTYHDIQNNTHKDNIWRLLTQSKNKKHNELVQHITKVYRDKRG